MSEDRRSKRIVLTDKALEKVRPTGKPFDLWDAVAPGLSARVHPSGKISFTALIRRAKGESPTRRTLGRYVSAKALGIKDEPDADADKLGEGALLTLAEARVAAKAAIHLMKRGLDPREVAAEKRAHEATRRAATLEAAAEAWLAEEFLGPDYMPKQRGKPQDPAHKPIKASGPGVASDVRQKLVNFTLKGKRLGDVPMSDVTGEMIMAAINADKRRGGRNGKGAPQSAARLLGYTKQLFAWAVHGAEFGITASPIADKSPGAVRGDTEPRDRTLWDSRSDTDPGAELRLFWRATERLPFLPWGAAYKLALLTGARRANIFGLTRSHIKLDAARGPRIEWPAAEMKHTRKSKLRKDFWLPLAPQAVALLESLPDLPDGPYLFSGTLGRSPASGFSKAQKAIQAAMLEIAKEDVVARGGDPRKVKLKPWRGHDLRRTFRTIIGECGTPEEVAELLIGHVPPRLVRTYEPDGRLDQRAKAMSRFGAYLETVLTPPPANVTSLEERRSTKRKKFG